MGGKLHCFIFLCFVEFFLDIRDIFYIFFSLSVARVKKYVKNVKEIQDKSRENEASQPNFVYCKLKLNYLLFIYLFFIIKLFCVFESVDLG